MNITDYIIIAALFIWLVIALMSIRKRKKKGGCCGGCGGCDGCQYSSQKLH